MVVTNSVVHALGAEERNRLERLLFEFEQSWHASRLAECVAELPHEGALRAAALAELVKIDLERHWQSGRRPTAEEYAARFPELLTAEGIPLDLIEAELEAQRRAGTADVESFCRRFPAHGEALRELSSRTVQSNPAPAPAQAEVGTSAGGPSTVRSAPRGQPAEVPERFGRYLIRRRLGQGGMGAVYLAHDTELGRDVALKVPQLDGDMSSETLERFFREARAAAALRHPHLCPVYDVGQIDGVHFLTMAYVEGRTLADDIKDGPRPPAEAAALVRQLALALDYAHQHGVVHRDLKPANVLLNAAREPAITDFGLARRVNQNDEPLTKTGALLGTPAYMSPEQVEGRNDEVGPPSDVYALGVILYELLTGQRPFRGTLTSIMVQIVTEEPEPPSHVRQDLPPQLEEIVMRAMKKKIGDRYESMGALAAALGEYLATEASGARPVNRIAHLLPETPAKPAEHPTEVPARRKRRWFLAAAGLLAAVVLIAGVIIIRIKDKDGKVVEEIKVPEGGSYEIVKPSDQKPADTQPKPAVPDKKTPDDPRQPFVVPTLVRQLTLPDVQGHTHTAVSPDGKTLAARNGSTAELWDLTTGKLRAELKDHPGKINHLEFSPGGDKLAVGCYKQVFIWNVATAKDPLILRGHTGDVSYVHFAADGKTLLSSGKDGTMRRWDAAKGDDLGTVLKNISHNYVMPSPDGKTLFVEHGLLDLETFKFQPLEGISYWTVQFSRDGKSLGQAKSDRVELWDLATRKHQMIHKLHTDDVVSVVLCPDGKTVASGSDDKTVILYDLETKKARSVIKAHSGPVGWVWVLRDGKTLASMSGSDPAVKFWDIATGAERGSVRHDHNIKFVGGADPLLLTVDQKGIAKVWDLTASKPDAEPAPQPKGKEK